MFGGCRCQGNKNIRHQRQNSFRHYAMSLKMNVFPQLYEEGAETLSAEIFSSVSRKF